MSRGMPSMTALLGMLAIAGYQNRDKLVEMFNSVAGSQRPGSGGQPQAQNNLPGSLSGMLGGAGVGGLLGGGLSELLEQFTKNGQGEAADTGGGPRPPQGMASRQAASAIDSVTTSASTGSMPIASAWLASASAADSAA